ncbi:hypothetical protein [Yinghuangia seranimata]|uniref:hypothetical protein n=1 Tax=Yinghuangia seranimata TaxID=408067 RepID=UPI00248BA254|nr:hypothetical protein [Yinghuangia seranimata]MDI2132294.1 hypothetical protein [Yinghuangia seranimata]
MSLVLDLLGQGVRLFAMGTFQREDGTMSTCCLTLTTLTCEIPDSGTTRHAVAGLVRGKWACEPEEFDVPAGPAVKWSSSVPVTATGVGGDEDGRREVGLAHQAHAAVVDPTGTLIAVLECSTIDGDVLGEYEELVAGIATTFWFDGEPPSLSSPVPPPAGGTDIRAILG